MELKRRYCSDCGALMGRKTRLVRFDEFNGTPINQYIFTCPNSRFWKIGHAKLTVTDEYQFDYLEGPQ